eukprot:UC1_evm1s478
MLAGDSGVFITVPASSPSIVTATGARGACVVTEAVTTTDGTTNRAEEAPPDTAQPPGEGTADDGETGRRFGERSGDLDRRMLTGTAAAPPLPEAAETEELPKDGGRTSL